MLIGINQYAQFPDLATPINDIEDLAGVLKSRYNFGDVCLLRNEQANEQGIRKAMADLMRRARRSDSLLIYFAGHGAAGKGQSGYWIPQDAAKNQESTYISNSDIVGFTENSRALHVLVISDSCFSGSIFHGNTRVEDALDYRTISSTKSRWVITSGNNTPVADSGPTARNSVFAHYMLQGLRTLKRPYLTPSQLTLAVTRSVSQASSLSQLPNCGALKDAGDEGGAFTFWNMAAFQEDGSPFPPPWEAHAVDFLPEELRDLKGHFVEVVGGNESHCEKLREIGLEVNCLTERRSRLRKEIVILCGDIRAEAARALQKFLDLRNYTLITHENRPENFRDDECGESFEITIRN
jgi:hypothetical protein